jgi:hypothetical protein
VATSIYELEDYFASQLVGEDKFNVNAVERLVLLHNKKISSHTSNKSVKVYCDPNGYVDTINRVYGELGEGDINGLNIFDKLFLKYEKLKRIKRRSGYEPDTSVT